MNKLTAAVFDIDGTLSPDISWLALTRDLGASVDGHIQIYNDYKQGKIDYPTSKSQLIGLWSATGNANKSFFGALFDALPLDPSAKSVTREAKIGRTVCLITGSMDMYAQIVARKLEIDHWYANTTLHWDSDGNLVDMDYELNQGQKKLKQFGQFCQKNNLQPNECLVVGDGENDEHLFEASQHGVLVGSSSAIESHAWRRVEQLADVEQILRNSYA